MRELLIDTREGTGEDGRKYRFDYFVLVDQIKLAGGYDCESYGVKIAEQEGGDQASVPNITTSITRLDDLMSRLARNLVTPTTLRDVVEDWL